MQTPSHLLITAVLTHKGTKFTSVPFHRHALLLGSVLPDIPFALLTLIYAIYYRWFAPFPGESSFMSYLHFELFYTDPVWLIGHNIFHSLLINMLLIALGYWGGRGWRWARPLFWLSIGTLFHTLIDIFTHHSDGPLLFFPLNWTYRFQSPVSYWEAAYYGRAFTVFEYTLNILLVVYLVWIWRKNNADSHRHGLEGDNLL